MTVVVKAGLPSFEIWVKDCLLFLIPLWRSAVHVGPTAVLPMARPGTTNVAIPAGVIAKDTYRLFEMQVLPHLDAAYNFARFLCRDADAAQDIVQDAFLRAYRGFDGYRGGDPKAWLFVIVRNCFNSWYQKRRQMHHFERSIDETDANDDDAASPVIRQLTDPEDTPETSALRSLQSHQIRQVISSLPPDMREVIVLRDLEDLSYKQIAEIIGTPVGTVMSRLARARQEFGTAWRELDAKGSR